MSDNETKEETPVDDNTVTLTIDDQQVTVAKGTNVLEAAKTVGVNISAFCYHPGLSIAACCRQCLVEIEGMPKLQPSCQMQSNNGMVVRTQAEKAVEVRKQMLEFTLLNHPIDCPICDKAGECTLQQLYFDHDNAPSRVDVDKVRKKPKNVDLGKHVVLDAERCILCTRCIRVCDEVAGTHELEMSWRGDKERLGTAPGASLDNPYSLNTVDVCPVGALTSKDFRFTMRAWELMTTPSICNGCSTGCNIEIHHKNGRAWRLIPRHNADVNQYWMCDEGRFTYQDLRKDRLATPLVAGMPSSWDNAVSKAAALIKKALANDPASVGVVLSAQHTNEDNYVLAKLARDIWQLDRVYVGGKAHVPGRVDDKLRSADVNPNSVGVKTLVTDATDGSSLAGEIGAGILKALIVLGHDVPLSEETLEKARNLDALVVISDREIGLASVADVALPSAAWAEVHGTLTTRKGLVQRMHAAFEPPGQAVPAWDAICRLGRACDAAIAYDSPEDIFTELASALESVDADSWGKDVPTVQLRWANSRG